MELFHNTNQVKANLNSTIDHFQNGIIVNALTLVKKAFSRGANQFIDQIGAGDALAYDNQLGKVKKVAILTTSSNTDRDQLNSVPIGKTSTFKIFKKDPRRIHQPDLTFDLVGENKAPIAREIALDIISDAHLTGKISTSIFITKDKSFRLVLFAFEGDKFREHTESLLSLKNHLHRTLLSAGCIVPKK